MNLNKFIYKLKQLPRHGADGDEGDEAGGGKTGGGGGGTGGGGGGGGGSTTGNITTTFAGTNILGFSIRLNGKGQPDTGFSISTTGFRFSTTNPPPTNTINNTTNFNSTNGSFNQTRTGLTSGQIYYAQAVVIYVDANDTYTTVTGSVVRIDNSGEFRAFDNLPSANVMFLAQTTSGNESIKDVFDSPESNQDVSLSNLHKFAGLGSKTSEKRMSNFFGLQTRQLSGTTGTLTRFHYSTGVCNTSGATTNIGAFHTGTGNKPISGDYVFIESGNQNSDPFAPTFWTNGGRINLLANGTYGLGSSGQSGVSVTSTMTISNGEVTSAVLCSNAGGGGVLPPPSERRLKKNIKFIKKSESGIPIYEFEYKNNIHGKGRFIGTMVEDLQILGYDHVLIKTDDMILVDYDSIDINFQSIGD